MKYTGERVIPEEMAKASIRIYKHHLIRYVFSLPYARDRKVLDAACGSGYGTDLLYDVANNILGIDNSKEAIEYAKNRYRGRFQVIDLEKDFPDEDFDIVVSFETIEHLENPDFFLENIKKRSKLFIFSIPMHGRVGKFHKKVYDIDSVKKLMNKHFNNTRWFSQRGANIVKGTSSCNYLIGSIKIK